MEKIVKYVILISLLVTLPSLVSAETFKWVDKNGVVTYSQTPPQDADAERIDESGIKKDPGPSSKEKLNQLRQRMADSAEDRDLDKKKKEKEKSALAVKKKNCDAARANLQKLKGLGTRLYKKDGEYKRLTEEERQSLMEQARAQIKSNCGS
jgi:hypothetical protein